ncbi:MAG: TauD/TfdA family dioxygenase [Alphaproteobacteria bacterium]
MANSNRSVKVERLGRHLGAEIGGVDLSAPLSDVEIQAILEAFVEHEVLVFRDQPLTREQYVALGRQFGELTIHPFATSLPDLPELIVLDNDGDRPPLSTDQWHSDEMFREEPPMATVLRANIIPDIGGDTLFASMTASYDGLHPSLQEFYSTLEAVNDFKVFRELYSKTRKDREHLLDMEDLFPSMTHPVVRVHPVSRKRVIYVSPQTTKYIKGVRDFESDFILAMLYQLPDIPEYQLRVRWEPNMIVTWDNRSTQHYAPRDYLPARRQMERLTVKGDQPLGVDGKNKTQAVEMNIRGTGQAEKTGQHREGLARPANTSPKKAP